MGEVAERGVCWWEEVGERVGSFFGGGEPLSGKLGSDGSILHRAKTWFTICVSPPCATIWFTGSTLKRKILYTVRTALRREDW